MGDTKYLDFEGLKYYNGKIQDQRTSDNSIIAEALEALDAKTEIQIGGITPAADSDIKLFIDEDADSATVYTAQQTESLINTAKNEVVAQIPTKVSELTNDKSYTTSSEVDSRIKAIVGAAPAALDTLEEIASKLEDNDDIISGITNTLANKADKSDLEVLINVQSDWNQTDSSKDDYIKNKPTLGALAAKDSLSASDVNALPASTTYAGSSSVGGSANMAEKLNVADTGASNKGVYFLNGVPVATSHTVNADVPSTAKFTDTIPSGQAEAASGKALTKVAIDENGEWSSEEIDLVAIQVQSDWNETDTTSKAYIQNKPTIPAEEIQIVADDTETIDEDTKIVIEANTDGGITVLTESQTEDRISTMIAGKANAADLAAVATTGSYNDLSNKPTIPVVNNATLTIKKNGTVVQTFTANASSDVEADIEVPTKTSDLTNDSNFAVYERVTETNANNDTQLIVDETADSSVEVYSKAQVDALIANIYTILQNNGLTI